MLRELDRSRRQAAGLALDGFDFGGQLTRSEDWVSDRDQLTCGVEVATQAGDRHLTFRVCFRPDSEQVKNIAVAERMALL